MNNFDSNVFLNCPFDDDYRQLLITAIFTVKYLGFNPRLSLERADSGESRILKIINLIQESKFGIHDLSRIVSESKDEHYRMNMPFELGIDYGCQKFRKGKWSRKKLLVLEKEKYRYQAALSDLSGSDIRNHNNDPIALIKAIRDWFITEELNSGPSHKKIWSSFNDFNANLHDTLIDQGHEKSDFDTVPITEIMHHISEWLDNEQQ